MSNPRSATRPTLADTLDEDAKRQNRSRDQGPEPGSKEWFALERKRCGTGPRIPPDVEITEENWMKFI